MVSTFACNNTCWGIAVLQIICGKAEWCLYMYMLPAIVALPLRLSIQTLATGNSALYKLGRFEIGGKDDSCYGLLRQESP